MADIRLGQENLYFAYVAKGLFFMKVASFQSVMRKGLPKNLLNIISK
jgi:hypothetical protein